jgi:ketosteroid isomerase-like protein
MSHNVETIQALYQAFGQGNLPAILERLSPNVRWEAWADHSAQRAGHPFFAARDGREGATEFFTVLAQQATVHEFKVLDLFGSGRQVAVEVELDWTYLPTGRRQRDEELHLWTFGDDGLVQRMRHYVDTAKHMRAAGLQP